jgi:Family of unknown function (DUF5419)
MKETFEVWMKEVDRILDTACGLTSQDIPDWMYYDAYEDGVKPTVAAKRALKAAGSF